MVEDISVYSCDFTNAESREFRESITESNDCQCLYTNCDGNQEEEEEKYSYAALKAQQTFELSTEHTLHQPFSFIHIQR